MSKTLPYVVDPFYPTRDEVRATARFWDEYGRPVSFDQMTEDWIADRLLALVRPDVCLSLVCTRDSSAGIHAFSYFILFYFILQLRLERWKTPRPADVPSLLEVFGSGIRELYSDDAAVLARLDDWTANRRWLDGAGPLIRVLRGADSTAPLDWEDVEEDEESAGDKGSDAEGSNGEGVGGGDARGEGSNDEDVGSAGVPPSREPSLPPTLPVSTRAFSCFYA